MGRCIKNPLLCLRELKVAERVLILKMFQNFKKKKIQHIVIREPGGVILLRR